MATDASEAGQLRQPVAIDGLRLSDRAVSGAVLTSSVDAFAGLGRPVVILAGLDDSGAAALNRNLYIGGSRASHHLIVLARETVAHRLREVARHTAGSPANPTT